MKKVYLLPLLMLFLLPLKSWSQERGALISDSLIAEMGATEILQIYELWDLPPFFFPVDYDIEIHKIVYWTVDAAGENPIQASGLVTIPVDESCDFPMLQYSHGTLEYDQVVSELTTKFNQHFIGVPFAAVGYVTTLPDYLGYGATPVNHPHPYVHAKSEATAGVDMLRAAKTFSYNYGLNLNDQLFLIGYSQGGHTTMALQRELEEFHSDEFQVTANVAGSGAYDLSGLMRDSIFLTDNYSSSFLLSFAIVSYEFVYGNIYDDLSDVFIAPYDTMIPQMLDRINPQSDFRDSLPEKGFAMLQPDFLAAVLADDMHPLNIALRDNDVYDWLPQGPLRLYYCEADEEIPIVNAFFTRDHMVSNGATNVTALSAGIDFDHVTCTYPTLLNAKVWFDGFREACSAVAVAEVSDSERLEVYPNPFESSVFIRTSEESKASFHTLTIYDLLGRKIFSSNIENQKEISFPTNQLHAGQYLFEFAGSQGSVWRKMVKG